jgi:drug/metabolite transporter (DMT)-like permease
VNTGLAVGAALGSALCFAVSSVLQQRGASRAPKGSGLHLSLLANLLARPMWLGGVLAAVGTVTLQALALAAGPLALVQPLLVSAVLFALPASVLLEKRRPSVVEWAWALLLVFGLAVFLRAAQPGTGPALPDDGPLLLMGAVAAAVAVSAAAVGRGPGRRHRAVLLGLATGIMYGLTASLIKYTVALARAEGWHLFLDWPVYALLVVGAVGIVLSQAAYQAGPLAGALPPLIIADPIVAIIVAVWAFGEELATDAVAVTFEVIGISAMALAIVRLAHLASGRGPRAGGRP